MYITTLRKVGGSVMLAVPPAFLDQLRLQPGATVGMAVDGERLVVQPRPRYSLSQLMAEMPESLPRVESWEDMPAVGLERF